MEAVFEQRYAAGLVLAEELRLLASPGSLVLGIARGGVPVGAAVAQTLHLAFDVLVVERLRLRSHPDLDAGALTSGEVLSINHDHLRALGLSGGDLEIAVSEATQRLASADRALRGTDPFSLSQQRRVIIVDDGMATGATMRAAVRGVRLLGATTIVVGVAVAAPEALDTLWGTGAHRVVCCASPFAFSDVASCFDSYEPVDDELVRDLRLHVGSDRAATA